MNDQGIWTGMLGGSVVQILLLTIITLRHKWEKKVQNKSCISKV